MNALFTADGLTDAVSTGPVNSAFVMTVPCLRLTGNMLIFPWPTQETATKLALHLDMWLISHTVASTLPLRCASQPAAHAAANAFAADVEAQRVAADDAGGVREWCRWWSARRDDAVPLDDWPGQWPR